MKLKPETRQLLRAAIPMVALVALFSAEPAHAGTAAPWEGAMQLVVDWLTGTTARLIIIVALAIACYGLAFAESGSAWRRFGYIALAGAILGVIVNVVDALMTGTGALLP